MGIVLTSLIPSSVVAPHERCEEIEEEVIGWLPTVSVQPHDRDCGVYYEAIIELSAAIFFAAS
jgi:hypothetical protein